jgi:cell division protein FtsQ
MKLRFPENAGKVARLAALAAVMLLLVGGAWWGPRVLSHLSFFRLQRVEVRGLQYLSEAEFLKLIDVDTTQSVWMDLGPVEERLRANPQLTSVSLARRLPGTLVVTVVERQPLALVAGQRGFTAIDESGAVIPLDPARGTMDVPILHSVDTLLVRLLAGLRDSNATMFNRIGEVRRVGRDELRLELTDIPVLAMIDVTPGRLLDILPVERDLAEKGMRVAELDLRFNGYVIARQAGRK